MIFIPTNDGLDGTDFLMVRKIEALGYSVHAMHRLEGLYGKGADSFRPERWDPDVKNAVDLSMGGLGPAQVCFQFKRLGTLSVFLQLHAFIGTREVYLNEGFQQFYKVHSVIAWQYYTAVRARSPALHPRTDNAPGVKEYHRLRFPLQCGNTLL